MVISALTIYTLVTAIIYLSQRALIYLPQKTDYIVDAEAISIDSNGLTLSGWVVNKGRNKAILYYGGNAENIEYNIPELGNLLSEYTFYFVPYRGYGNNSGSPTEQDLYQDALAVFDSVSSQHNSISLIGRSLGTGVATYVAANRKIARMALVTPYDSLLNVARKHYWWLPVSFLLKDKYESWRRTDQVNAPVLLIAAENDRIIGKQHTLNLADSFKPDQVTLEIIEGADHNSISVYSDYYKYLLSFFSAQ